MKKGIDEFGEYGIGNPDGQLKRLNNEKSTVYRNDDPRFIKENSSRTTKESFSCEENFSGCRRPDDGKKAAQSAAEEQARQQATEQAANATSAANQAANAASTVARGVQAASVGLSGLGAVAGFAAAAVTTAVVVVAYVALAFSVTVSLFAATAHSLTFLFEIENEENKPLVAILSGDEDYWVAYDLAEERYLTFDGLTEGGEYLLVVKDKDTEEVFYKQSFATPEIDRQAYIVDAFLDGETLSFCVEAEGLERTDFYTLTVTNEKGDVLFVHDDSELSYFCKTSVDEETPAVMIQLKINGKPADSMRVERYVPVTEPSYDYQNAAWAWTGVTSVTATVPDRNGGDPLVISPQILNETLQAATCDTAGVMRFYAVIEDEEENTYFDEKTEEIAPLGHEYGSPWFDWEETETGYEVTAVFTCVHDQSHINHVATSVTKAVAQATCTENGAVTYTATVSFDQHDYEDTRVDELTATGHTFGEFNEEIPATCEADGEKAHYYCEVCEKYFDENENELTEEDLVIVATGHTYGDLLEEIPATCEETGMRARYCCEVCEKFFDENKAEVTEESLTIAALGHAYGEPEWDWEDDGNDGFTATAHFVCSRCGHAEEAAGEVMLASTTAPDCSTETNGSKLFTATVTFDNTQYEGENLESVPFEHTPAAQTPYVFPDELTGIDYATGELSGTVYATYTCTTCEHEVQVACHAEFTVISDGPVYTLSVGDQQSEYMLAFNDGVLEYDYDEENERFFVACVVTQGQSGNEPSDPEPITEVTIPTTFYGKPVVGVKASAFGGSDVTTLTVGSHITEIEEYAFAGAFNLTTVVLSGADVPAYAFEGDSGLMSVTVPSGTTSIGAHAFDGCSSLTELTIPASVTSIGEGAFARMSALETLTVPFIGGSAASAEASEQTLLGYWFVGGDMNAGGLAEISQGYSMEVADEYYIPESLATLHVTGGKILYGALMNCNMLTTVTVGDCVEEIHAGAFLGIESASVTISCGESESWQVYDAEEEFVTSYTAADLAEGEQNLTLLTNGAEAGHVWKKYTE